MEEELEIGTDITELFKKTGSQPFEFEHNGKRWQFKYKELSWEEHFLVIEGSYDTRTGLDGVSQRFFNASRYYAEIFKVAILEIPGGKPLVDTYLRMLPSDVVTKMLPMVPGPTLDVAGEEAKKDLTPSPDGETT